MPFEGVGPYYLNSGVADGANNRTLTTTSLAGTDQTTLTPAIPTSATTVGMRPRTTGVAATYTTVGRDYGWNMQVTNTDATANTPASRTVPAGTWTVLGGLNIASGSTGYPLGGVITATINCYARTSSSGALRYLGALSGTATPSVGAIVAITCSGSISAVTLAAGETIHMEVWLACPAATLSSYTIAYNIGTYTVGLGTQNSYLTLPGVGLRYQYLRSYLATDSSAANIIRSISLSSKLATASPVGAMTRLLTLNLTLLGTSTGTATYNRALTMFRAFSATSSSAAIYNRVLTLFRTFSATSSSIALYNRLLTLFRQFSATSSATATANTRLTLFRSVVATSSANAIYSRVLTLFRSFSASSTTAAHKQPFAILFRPLLGQSGQLAHIQPFQIAFRPIVASSTAIAALAKALSKNVVASSTSSAFYARALMFARTLTATSTGNANMLVQISQAILNRMSGGGTTIIKKFLINIFED